MMDVYPQILSLRRNKLPHQQLVSSSTYRVRMRKYLVIFIQKGLIPGNKFLLSYQLRMAGLTEGIYPN